MAQGLGSCLGGRVTQFEKSRPQNWAKQDLRKMIYSAIDDKKADGRITTELKRKALGNDQRSPFTQRIQDSLPPNKFSQQKFNIYDGCSDPADHVRHYKQVMAYWRNEEVLMCIMFPASLKDTTLRWFNKLSLGKDRQL